MLVTKMVENSKILMFFLQNEKKVLLLGRVHEPPRGQGQFAWMFCLSHTVKTFLVQRDFYSMCVAQLYLLGAQVLFLISLSLLFILFI